MISEKDRAGPFPNFRDLGGFKAKGGKYARSNVYFRSGMPAHIDREELSFLKVHGIRTVLDFRIDEERNRAGWYQIDNHEVTYVRIPYYDQNEVARIRKMEENHCLEWSLIYNDVLIEGRDWIRKVFEAIALSRKGLLFHCASGKDRTGIIAALLLDLLGADPVWIYIDYALSWYEMKHDGGSFYRTSPKTMRDFLAFLRDSFGGSESYLIRIGVSASLLQAIKSGILM